MISFAQEMVIHTIKDGGTITEVFSMPMPTEPDRGKYISFGDDEYILGFFGGTFCLVSLTYKRVEMYIPEVCYVLVYTFT